MVRTVPRTADHNAPTRAPQANAATAPDTKRPDDYSHAPCPHRARTDAAPSFTHPVDGLPHTASTVTPPPAGSPPAHPATNEPSAIATDHTADVTSGLGWAAVHFGRRGTAKGQRHPGPTHRRSAHRNETGMSSVATTRSMLTHTSTTRYRALWNTNPVPIGGATTASVQVISPDWS
jgi:hypothetical protein